MSMEFIVLLAIIVAGFAGIFWYLAKSQKKDPEERNSLMLLQNQINEIFRSFDQRLAESTKLIHAQFGHSTRIIQEVTEKLIKVEESNRRVVGFAEQLQRLQDILQNPKQRGVFGEFYLETLLKSAFHPKQYQMQYKFNDGTAVDAVIFFGDRIIPIDSKFSLENYNRILEEKDAAKREQLEKTFKQDLKNRIDETAKYIRPEEGTTDFAFMFIPAEGIYYDLLINQVGSAGVSNRDLLHYAVQEKRVHIVSPTTFYVALQSLWQSIRDKQLQESTKQILKNVDTLGKHLRAYEEYFKKLGAHLGTTVNTYNQAYRELGKIDKDVLKLTGESTGIETQLIEGPAKD